MTSLIHRSQFPLLAAAPELVYLDSAATSQKPRAVLDAVRDFYENDYANPHRGAYELSVRATTRYHAARERVASFLGVRDADCVIFTRGTTEALNLVAGAWGRANVNAGDEVVVTGAEHHANFVPWQQLALERGARFRICEIESDGTVDLDRLRALLSPRTKVVAFAHVSNVLGTIAPVREMAELAHRVGALAVCDGAQGAPHLRVRFDEMGVDVYAASGHKMLGPMGIGVLAARRELLERMPPFLMGGDMIEFVEDDHSTWNVLPHKFEAGTPNAAGAVGLAAAVDVLEGVGMDAVRAHEHALVASAYDRLSAIDGVHIHGPGADARGGVLSFTVGDVHPHDLATILDTRHVCIRAGHHCAQPLMRRLGVSATARASFYVYNDASDVDALAGGIVAAKELFGSVAV
ncbi:MAG TPA: SufS family cysteine desulfurase [Gemmatimonadaceae bacterium]|jgi:cysteine desulfurase/selenocysteine lyase